MGRFGWAFCCKIKHLILENEIIHLMFKLNLQNRIEQERPFSSEATMSPKISSSPFFTFSEKIVDFSWKRLLIVLITYFNHPVGWHPFFDIFSLPERRPDTILDPLWFLFEPSLGLVMLRLIFLLMDHSDTYNSAFRNRTHLIFFIFPIDGAIYVVIVIL